MHTCVKGKVVEEVRDILEWGYVGTTTLARLGLSATVLTFVPACFLVFTVTGLGAPVGLGVSFFGLAVFLVVVTSGCFGVSVTT